MTLAPGPLARQEVAVAAMNNSVYVIGGYTARVEPSADVQIYDAATNSWTLTTPVPVPLHHAGAAWVSGRLYVFGGFTGVPPIAVNQTYIFTPETGRWEAGAPMLERKAAFATVVVGGQIYLLGGIRDGLRLSSVDVFDAESSSWSMLPNMPTARDHLVAGLLGGGLIAVGGRATDTQLELTTVEVFDLATQTWRILPPLPTGRSGSAAAVFGSRFYVFGGEYNRSAPSGVFATTEFFDLVDGQWHTGLAMEIPKHGTGAVTIGNMMIIPEGATAADIAPTSSCEAYVSVPH